MRKFLDLLTFLLFSITLAVYLPGNSLIESQNVKKNFVSFLPQGWAFFTKDPQEVKAIAYTVHNGVLKEFNKTGNRLQYATGLKRTQRVLGIELSDILTSYSMQKLKNEFETEEKALSGEFIHISNKSISKSLCGKVIINLYKDTPWIWFSNDIKVQPFKKYINLDIHCG